MPGCRPGFFVLLFLLLLSPQAASGEVLRVPGTGDSQELLRALADAFMGSRPGLLVEIPDSVGSSGGIRMVLKGEARLARVARPPKEKEKTGDLHYRVFARSPVVLVANLAQRCLDGLDSSQVTAVFRGEISDWSQLGSCPAGPIYVANREPGDSSRSVFEQFLPGFAEIGDPVGEVVYSTPDTAAVLSRHPGTIGYLPLAMVDRQRLRVLAIDGVAPTEENVASGLYRFTVPFGLVWRGELTGVAASFRDFLFGEEAGRLIRQQGARPVSNE